MLLLLLRSALLAALRNRRVQAAFKYWCVLVLMLVGTLLLMYFVPVSAMLSPTFGYTLAAVGMSDRVESTVFKVGKRVWQEAGGCKTWWLSSGSSVPSLLDAMTFHTYTSALHLHLSTLDPASRCRELLSAAPRHAAYRPACRCCCTFYCRSPCGRAPPLWAPPWAGR